MPNLNTLHLRATELRAFPASILGLSELEVVDLSENLITELPNDLFIAPTYITEALDLEDNPLSHESLDRVREYFTQTGIDLNVEFEAQPDEEPVIVSDAEE